MAPKDIVMPATMRVTFVFMLILQGAWSTPKVTELVVPPHTPRNENVTLECKYDTGTDKLYAVKWYHDGFEIFKYAPQDTPQITISPSDKIRIIESESTPEQIVLQEVDLSAAGSYSCEVHADWPEFESDKKSKNMTVVVIPNEQPSIEGDVPGHYRVGDPVNLNCTAPPSIPAAALNWLINDREAKGDHLHRYPVEKLEDGLMISNLGLIFNLSKDDFINGELKLKCTATIAAFYSQSDEHSQQGPTTEMSGVHKSPTSGTLVRTPGNAAQRMLGPSLFMILFYANLLW